MNFKVRKDHTRTIQTILFNSSCPEMLARLSSLVMSSMSTLLSHLPPFMLLWTQLKVAPGPCSGSYNCLLSRVFCVQRSGPCDLRAYILCKSVVILINLKSHSLRISPSHPTYSHLTMQSAGIWPRKYTSKNKAQLGGIAAPKKPCN